MHPLIRLMRPALAPTAAADVLAAAAIAGGARFWPLAGAVLGSMCLYAGGMVQNDLCDRDRDQKLHPNRPLIRHPHLAKYALLMFVGLFAVGLLLCARAGAPWPAILVVVLASAYNLGLKGTFPADAVAMGAARACNLWIGLAIVGAGSSFGGGFRFTYLAAYLLFIAGITAASRTEDVEPKKRRRLGLSLAFVPIVLALGAFASLASESAELFLIPFAILVLVLILALVSGTREATMRFVLRSLLAIFLVHAVCLWTQGGRASLIPIAACAALSFVLLRWMRPAPPPTSPRPESP